MNLAFTILKMQELSIIVTRWPAIILQRLAIGFELPLLKEILITSLFVIKKQICIHMLEIMILMVIVFQELEVCWSFM